MKAVKIVLAEDPGSVPKTVLGSSQPPVTPVSEAPISSSGLLGICKNVVHINSPKVTNLHII